MRAANPAARNFAQHQIASAQIPAHFSGNDRPKPSSTCTLSLNDYSQMTYAYLLAFHSWVRWIVLVGAVLAVAASIRGWSSRTALASPWNRFSTLFVAAMDLQFLIGLILYLAVSPLTRAAFANMAAAMKDHEQRFFTVEHTTYMLIALVLAHVGGVWTRKGKADPTRYRGATIAFGISLLLILAGIPWWRPLLRMI
jgi:hypothetical protein